MLSILKYTSGLATRSAYRSQADSQHRLIDFDRFCNDQIILPSQLQPAVIVSVVAGSLLRAAGGSLQNDI